MKNIKNKIFSICSTLLEDGVSPLFKTENNFAYFLDPVLNLNRNRVNTEILKSIMRLKKIKNKVLFSENSEKILNWILSQQNENGSWNEIHSFYNQESALLTSFVGELLLLIDNKKTKTAVRKAKKYVLSQELNPGYFKKSYLNYADCLNVNATCGAFLAEYYEKYKDNECYDAANRAANRVCQYQFINGAFPYTTKEIKNTSKLHYYVPCIHYQGVTMFFLSKIHKILQEDLIKIALERGAEWLASVQKKNGKFDWSEGGLMYAYTLAAAYGFAASSFLYVSKFNSKYEKNACLCLDVLKKNIHGLVNRWEEDSMITLPRGFIEAIKTAGIGDYPLNHRFFRLGYGFYKQFSRRRYSDRLDDKFFKKLSAILKIDSTWIEPIKNYPDLFNTSEVLDCLTSSYAQNGL